MEIVFRTGVKVFTNKYKLRYVYNILRKVRKHPTFSRLSIIFMERRCEKIDGKHVRRDIFAERRYRINMRVDKSRGTIMFFAWCIFAILLCLLQKLARRAGRQSLAIAFSSSKWIFSGKFARRSTLRFAYTDGEANVRRMVTVIYRQWTLRASVIAPRVRNRPQLSSRRD